MYEIIDSSIRDLRTLILGAQLAQLREDRGVTRQVLAHRIGIAPWHISQIERGRVHDVEQVRDYVNALDGTLRVTPDGDGYAVSLA